MNKTNVNGGAIALGHPVGTSGARITGHLVHELRRIGAKYAVGSACIGGGQGIAVVLENVQWVESLQLNWKREFQQQFCGILMKKNIFAWKECMNVKVTKDLCTS